MDRIADVGRGSGVSTAELLELARNRLASLEASRRALWSGGDENAIIDIDSKIADTIARIAELEQPKG